MPKDCHRNKGSQAVTGIKDLHTKSDCTLRALQCNLDYFIISNILNLR